MSEFIDAERDDQVFPEYYHCRECGRYLPSLGAAFYTDDSELPVCRDCLDRVINRGD